MDRVRWVDRFWIFAPIYIFSSIAGTVRFLLFFTDSVQDKDSFLFSGWWMALLLFWGLMGDCFCGDQHIKDLVSISLTLLYCSANKAHRNMEGHYPYATHQKQTCYIFFIQSCLHFIPILSNNVWTGLNLSLHPVSVLGRLFCHYWPIHFFSSK